ncbi:MAG: nitroreductase family protein [Candidatus Cloacimonetes bacterium]|nr:nitroreductase family protein [Candidatus Cloacimonadota bacterium]
MEISEALLKRRAFKNLVRMPIAPDVIEELQKAAQLAPSCFNRQPWRYVMVNDNETLNQLREVYSEGNEWAYNASLVVAVVSRKDYDCIIRDREYYLFDTGLSSAFLILQATALDLVAHPIAGFSPKKVRRILSIPEEMSVVTLIIIGQHDKKKEEEPRPTRKNPREVFFMNRYRMEQADVE